MRNRLRVLAFDVLAPAAAIAALVFIGVALAWPLWWVSVASMLCLLIVQAVIASSGVMRNSVQPIFITASRLVMGEVPGLQSVASAIGTL